MQAGMAELKMSSAWITLIEQRQARDRPHPPPSYPQIKGQVWWNQTWVITMNPAITCKPFPSICWIIPILLQFSPPIPISHQTPPCAVTGSRYAFMYIIITFHISSEIPFPSMVIPRHRSNDGIMQSWQREPPQSYTHNAEQSKHRAKYAKQGGFFTLCHRVIATEAATGVGREFQAGLFPFFGELPQTSLNNLIRHYVKAAWRVLHIHVRQEIKTFSVAFSFLKSHDSTVLSYI